MQYFTFLGMGPIGGYKIVEYHLNNKSLSSSFVQELIFLEHLKEIDEVVIFSTDKAYEKNGEALEKILFKANSDIVLNLITIDQDVSFEEITDKLSKNIKSDFIMDVTHSFRDIPMTVLLSLNYLENSSNCRLKHLYYGKGFENSPYEIIDFIDSYRLSALGAELQQFQKTLKIDLDFMIENYTSDSSLTKFFESIKEFNQMIEFCDFDNSLLAVREITSSAKKIKSKNTKYKLLLPFVDSIINMLEPVAKEKDVSTKKINLINLLLEHRLIQIAITFTDQFLREEIIHYTIDKSNPTFQIEEIQSNRCIRQIGGQNGSLSDYIYKLSQYLIIDVYNLREVRNYQRTQHADFDDRYFDTIDNNNQIIASLDKSSIDTFYLEIRNMINHGSEITLTYEEIITTIKNSIQLIESLRCN